MKDRFGESWERLFEPAIAHRGLWSPDGPPENSLGAFQAACAAGYGIEFIAPLGVSTESEVSARDIAKIITQVKKSGIPAVFLENISDDRLMRRISAET